MTEIDIHCPNCGKELDVYDVGCYRKLVHRGAKSCLCRDCLAVHLNCTRASIDAMIPRFQRQGCVLFPPLEKEKKID